jgi:PET Domain/LIM domain
VCFYGKNQYLLSGLGRKCLVCEDKCVGGLNLHFWRKICINCQCPKEKHDLRLEDYSDLDQIFDVLGKNYYTNVKYYYSLMQFPGVKVPVHKNLFKYSAKNPHKETAASSVNNHNRPVEWVPLTIEKDAIDDQKRNDKINKYFEDLGESKIPFINSDAALKRKELAQVQIPPHDFNPEKCDELTDYEKSQLQKYVENVKKNALGQGQIDVVEVPLKSFIQGAPQSRATTSNPFMRHANISKDLNAINNNNLANDMGNLTIADEIKCRECTLQITGAYVKAERLKGHWHPKCFKCKKCSQLLVDLIYFHYKNEIYCARDLAELMQIPRCAACDELILVPEYTLADNNNYHLKHFCCIYCDMKLAGHQYVTDEKTNNPVCLDCYEKHFSNSCGACRQNIAPNEQGVSIKDLHFHLNCFNCANQACAKMLIGSRFCIRNNLPFCSECARA